MEKDVPYIVYEGTIARFERTVRRLLWLLAFVIFLLVASNGYWIYNFSLWDFSDVTVDSQDGGNASYIGANGVVNTGESGSKEKSKKE